MTEKEDTSYAYEDIKRARIAGGVVGVIIGVIVALLLCYLWHWYFSSDDHTATTTSQASVDALKVDLANTKNELTETKAALAKAEAVACKDKEETFAKGDTLWGFALKDYGGRGYFATFLQEVNGITDPTKIPVGTKIKVPCCLCSLPALPVKSVEKKANAPIVPKVSRVEIPTTQIGTPAEKPIQQIEAPAPKPEPVVTPAPVPTPAPIVIPAPVVNIAPPVNNIVVNVPKQEIPAPVATVVAPAPTRVPPAVIPAPELQREEIKGPRWSGSVTSSSGNLPTDKHNWAILSHFDIGANLLRSRRLEVGPGIACDEFSSRKDTSVFFWDQFAQCELVLRAIKPIHQKTLNGYIEIGGGLMGGYRASGHGKPETTRSTLTAYLATRLEWDNPFMYSAAGEKEGVYLFPGNFSGTLRKNLPFEKNNLIGYARLEQGVTIARKGSLSFVPEIYGSLGWDKLGNPWNNRLNYGGDFKIAVTPWRSGTLSFKPGYGCSIQKEGKVVGNGSGCGLTVGAGLEFRWGNKNPSSPSSLRN